MQIESRGDGIETAAQAAAGRGRGRIAHGDLLQRRKCKGVRVYVYLCVYVYMRVCT
jgi:hypothetical protein